MRGHRLTILKLMVAIAIVAAGLSAFRADVLDWRVYSVWHEYVITVLPMACLLTYGLVVGASDLIRLGRCRPFLVGFEVTGWAVLFACASFMAVSIHTNDRILSRLDPLTQYTFGTTNIYYLASEVLAFHLVVLNVPQLALALLGGWAAHSLGVTLVRGMESEPAG